MRIFSPRISRAIVQHVKLFSRLRSLAGGGHEFWRKTVTKTMNDPARAVAEMRDMLDRVVEQARQDGIPSYRIRRDS
jgi:hypothetical protein